MGFPEMYAVAALRQTDNDLNASMDALQRRRRKAARDADDPPSSGSSSNEEDGEKGGGDAENPQPGPSPRKRRKRAEAEEEPDVLTDEPQEGRDKGKFQIAWKAVG